MDNRLQSTIEAVESTKRRDWNWNFYHPRCGKTGVKILILFAGQFHKISVHNCQQCPEPEELAEAIRGIKQLDRDRTWIYKTQNGIPGFSTTAWSTVPLHGSTSHAFMISRTHELPE